MAISYLKLSFILLLGPFSNFNLIQCIAKESVPVLIWNDHRPQLDIPVVSALPVPFTHFQGEFLKPFHPNNVILFLQDTLSVEDLSSHEKEFKHVSHFMEESHSLYLPAVEVVESIPHAFVSQGYNLVAVEAGSAVAELKLKANSPNLVLVKLPSTRTNPSRQNALQKSDEIIENVLSKIGKLADFTIIYTGKGPSVNLERRISHSRVTREADPTNPEDPKLHFDRCVTMYLRDDIIVQTKKNNATITYYLMNNQTTTSNADCQEMKDTLTIWYKDIDEFTKISAKFIFIRDNHLRWRFDSVELTAVDNNAETPDIILLYPTFNVESIPANKSYACSKRLVFKTNESDISRYQLVLDGVQVEPFGNYMPEFSDAWDCVGFFTVPIWMGIIAGVIMTIILLIGMYMLSDIKTMDRFDDPKGKHIMVTATVD